MARALFGESRFVWLWLAARVYLGWLWLDAGRQKLREDAWMDSGLAVRRLWERSLLAPEQSRLPLAYDWRREIVQSMLDHRWYTWVAPLIAITETLFGIALILGLFTGVVAVTGSLLNVTFMLTGVASTNPVLFVIAVALMLAWRTAGWIGLDRWVLPIAGRAWRAETTPDGRADTRRRRHPARAVS